MRSTRPSSDTSDIRWHIPLVKRTKTHFSFSCGSEFFVLFALRPAEPFLSESEEKNCFNVVTNRVIDGWEGGKYFLWLRTCSSTFSNQSSSERSRYAADSYYSRIYVTLGTTDSSLLHRRRHRLHHRRRNNYTREFYFQKTCERLQISSHRQKDLHMSGTSIKSGSYTPRWISKCWDSIITVSSDSRDYWSENLSNIFSPSASIWLFSRFRVVSVYQQVMKMRASSWGGLLILLDWSWAHQPDISAPSSRIVLYRSSRVVSVYSKWWI